MKAVIKLFLFLIISTLALTQQGFALQQKSTHTHVVVRRPPAEKISKFQSDRNFNYEVVRSEHISLWDRFTNWLARHSLPKRIPGGYTTANTIWTIIELLIIAGAIFLFVYFILKSQGVSLFAKNSGSNLQFTEAHEDISQMNFDELIATAAGNRQYRQAIRYLYLKSLKQLSDHDLIKWKAEKTNHDYTIELRASPFSKLFSEITLLFDYAWYGNATINESTFVKIQSSFEQFNRQTAQKI